MHISLWTVAGAVAGLVTIISILLGRRGHQTDPDLGSVSSGWVSEHRTSSDRDS